MTSNHQIRVSPGRSFDGWKRNILCFLSSLHIDKKAGILGLALSRYGVIRAGAHLRMKLMAEKKEQNKLGHWL